MPDTALPTECRFILARCAAYESIGGIPQARIRSVLHALDAAIEGATTVRGSQLALFGGDEQAALPWEVPCAER